MPRPSRRFSAWRLGEAGSTCLPRVRSKPSSVPWKRPTTLSSSCSKPPPRGGAIETVRRLVSSPPGNPVSPRRTDVTTKDDRTNIFGIPYEPPERDEAVAQYQRRSIHKLHIAEWHGGEFEGTVALAEARARWTDTLGRVSDHEGQFGEPVGKPGERRHVGPEIVEAPAEVLDEGVRSDDDPGGTVSLQPSHRSEPGLQASVVSLDAVVRIHLRVMEGRRQQRIEDARVDPVPIGGDLDG